jgi:mono/diheme cytochrome c family protein
VIATPLLTSLRTGLIVAFWVINVSASDQKPQDIYKANCQGCHGATGRPSPVGKGLGAKSFQDPAVIKTSLAETARIIAKGKNNMPAFESTLTLKEIKDLAKYIRELK